MLKKVNRKVEELLSRRRAGAVAAKLGLQRSNYRRDVFLVPTNVLRSLYFMPLSDAHPQVGAAKLAADMVADEEIKACLRKFYDLHRALRYQDYIGMSVRNSGVSVARPYEVPLPWANRSIDRQKEISHSNARKESRDFGASLSVDEYWIGIGPMSEAGIAVEAARIRRVSQSISAKGYQPSRGVDGDIAAYLLTAPDSSNSYRVQIVSGTHRAAVLVASGWQQIPIRLIGIVDRSRSATWHGVRKGYFSNQEAAKIFDRVWNGVG